MLRKLFFLGLFSLIFISCNKSYKVNDNIKPNGETEQKGIAGLYYASEIKVIKKENVSHRETFIVLDNNMPNKNDIYFEITHIEGNWFNISYHFPFFESADPEYDNLRFQFFLNQNTPFCTMTAERGGGGTEISLYYMKEQIILDMNYYFNPNMEEGDNYAIEGFNCEIIFNNQE